MKSIKQFLYFFLIILLTCFINFSVMFKKYIVRDFGAKRDKKFFELIAHNVSEVP